jgi:hypothetical protein
MKIEIHTFLFIFLMLYITFAYELYIESTSDLPEGHPNTKRYKGSRGITLDTTRCVYPIKKFPGSV